MDNERLKELIQADKEGRIVILPCKIGDVFYTIEVEGKRPDDVPILAVKEHICRNIIDLLDFLHAKLVFKTREEAEIALFKMQGGGSGG